MRRRTALITLGVLCAAAAAAIAIVWASGSRPGRGRLYRARLVVAGASYRFSVYVPGSYGDGSAAPLVVVLHGCNTTPDQQVAASGYDPIADRSRFIVLYPDVDSVDAGQGRCWKGIWDPGTEGRGRGDAAAIAGMTRAVMARWHVDRSRVYAIGISAGAFEASILGAVYPDLFAAIGIHSGAAYMQEACLAAGASPAATSASSQAALAAMGPRARVMPVIVFHGDADLTVPYSCGQQALAQWVQTDDLVLERTRRAPLRPAPSFAHGAVPGGQAYTVTAFADGRGCPVAELWTIHGMGHYWSGGSAAPASSRYSDPRGPSAAASSWAFFSRWQLSESGCS